MNGDFSVFKFFRRRLSGKHLRLFQNEYAVFKFPCSTVGAPLNVTPIYMQLVCILATDHLVKRKTKITAEGLLLVSD